MPITLVYSRNEPCLPERLYLKASIVTHGFSPVDLTAMEARFYDELGPTIGGEINPPVGHWGFVDDGAARCR